MKFQLFFTRKFTFQSAASASFFHAGPCFSADWGEMTYDVNSRTHASVAYTFYTIIPVFHNTVFLGNCKIGNCKGFIHFKTAKVSPFSSPNHCLEDIYEDQILLSGSGTYEQPTTVHLLRIFSP